MLVIDRPFDEQDIDESVMDLIADFALAIMERDKYLLEEVITLAQEKVEFKCRCYEKICVCEQ